MDEAGSNLYTISLQGLPPLHLNNPYWGSTLWKTLLEAYLYLLSWEGERKHLWVIVSLESRGKNKYRHIQFFVLEYT